MAFCTECRHQLEDGANFCFECGAKVTGASSPRAEKRKIVYDGEIHKCPNCGEVIHSFELHCPSCGYEMRGTKATSSVRELAQKLEAIEACRQSKPPEVLKKRLRGEEITDTDKQKISLIRSFPIPNTKEDLYEFLILAGSNIDVYDGTLPVTDARIAVSDAWKAKFEQAYQKANLVLSDDDQLAEIQDLYTRKHKEIKKANWKPWRLLGVIWGVVFLLVALNGYVIVPIQERNEIERLEKIVSEIEIQLRDGEYKYALLNADGLLYNGPTDDEQSRKWRIEREYWIDKVITEAAKNGVTLELPKGKDE